MTVRNLVKEHPDLWEYDYKWKDSENFRYIQDALSDYGYWLKDNSIAGEYNDLKGYLDCELTTAEIYK